MQARKDREPNSLPRVYKAHDEHDPAPTIDITAEHVHDIRWWSVDELDSVDPDQLAPRALARSLRDVIEHGPPPAPIDVGV